MSELKFTPKCQLQTDFFNRRDASTAPYRPDQCVLGTEPVLPHVRGFHHKKPKLPQPDSMDWYPLVNAYYNHAEDVDAFQRVNELLAERPSLPSIPSECDQPYASKENGTPYSEHQAHLQYLASRPASFVVLGKPEVGQQEIGRRLEEHWGCVHIEPERLISEEIESGSRAGECIEFNLRCGRAIGIDVILRLMEKRVRSKTSQHRGFVLTGVPVVANDLYEEDPVSSESAVFAVHEIFDEIYDAVVESAVPVTKHVSIVSQSRVSDVGEEAEVEEQEEKGEEKPTGMEEEEIPDVEPISEELEAPDRAAVDVGSAHGSICREPTIGAGCDEQLQFLFRLMEPPLVAVYVKCPHDDVISRRNDFRYDVVRNVSVDMQAARLNAQIRSLYSKEPGAREYEEPADLLEEGRYEAVSKLTHLVRLPRHFPANVAAQLKKYHLEALPRIERFVLAHDPQYFLKVDGRLSPHMMFDVVKTRLEVLPLQRVLIPERLGSAEAAKEGEELDEAEADADAGDSSTPTHRQCFARLRGRQAVPGPFKWGWSDWGVKCPVAMREGTYRDGSTALAVRFMNKMFFLSDEEAAVKFARNPRPYLLPPYPRPSCRVFVFGPRASGRTTVARCLAYLLDGRVLDVEEMKDEYMTRKRMEHKEQVKQAALIEAINILNERKEQKRQYRDDLLTAWNNQITATVTSLSRRASRWKPKVGEPLHRLELALPVAAGSRSCLSEETLHAQPPVITLTTIAEFRRFLAEQENLRRLLPPELAFGADLDVPASVLDKFVTAYAEELAAEASLDFSEFTDEHLADTFMTIIKEVEDKHEEDGGNRGGWIVDNIPVNLNMLGMLHPHFMADDIIVLHDENHHLLKNYSRDHVSTFRNFRQLFLDVGRVDAAWRAPATDSTPSIHKGFVQEILYDMVNKVYSRPEHEERVASGEQRQGEPPSWGRAVAAYADHLRQYEEELENLYGFLEDRFVAPIRISVGDGAITDTLKEVVRVMEDRYKPPPRRMTDEDRYEESLEHGRAAPEAAGEFAEEEGGGGREAEDTFQKNRRYGDTSWYCPVTFRDSWVLWRGREEHAVKHDDKVYLMATEADVETFLTEPRRYTFGNQAPTKMPPPRICVVGNIGVGKTTVAKALAKNNGLIYVGFKAYLESLASLGPATDAVNVYLAGTGPLPEGYLEQFFQKVWWSEPCRTAGFVLDDFPKSPSDVTALVQAKAIPDLIVKLTVYEGEVKKRLLERHMSKFQRQKDADRAVRMREFQDTHEEWQRDRTKRYQELIEDRRQLRYAQKLEQRAIGGGDPAPDEAADGGTHAAASAASQVTYDSFADQEDQMEIGNRLDVELPEPVFEEEEYDQEEVAAQFEEAIELEITSKLAFMSEIKEACLREQIPWTDVDANLDETHTIYQAYIATGGLKDRRASFLERCYDVDMESARQLLAAGYYFTSPYGKTCPVQYDKRYNPIQMYLPEKLKGRVYPIIHRQFIYFLCGEDARIEFVRDPLKYTATAEVRFPLIPYRMAVVGAPKAGKTTLVRRMQAEYSLKAVSSGQAVRHVLAYMPFSRLAVDVEGLLREGASVTCDLQMRCVEAAHSDPHAQTQGVVFDGFPNDVREARLLRDLGLMPHLVLHLSVDEEEVYEHLKACTETRGLPVYSRHFLEIRHGKHRLHYPTFRDYMGRQYQNVADVGGGRSSVWATFRQAQELFLSVFSEVYEHLKTCTETRGLPVYSRHFLEIRHGKHRLHYPAFRDYMGRQYQNVADVGGGRSSVWATFRQAQELFLSVFSEVQHYHRHAHDDWPLRVASMLVTPMEFTDRRSHFKTFCPCCLFLERRLLSGGDPPDRTNLVHFGKHLYWICDGHVEMFIKTPDRYVPPMNPVRLPADLPVRKSLPHMPKDAYENGVCIVCYSQNRQRKVFTMGAPEQTVGYRGAHYLFDGAPCLERFMEKPQEYADLTICYRDPENMSGLRVEDLPVLGYLEQYVAKDVIRALNDLVGVRPVVPGLSVDISAAVHLGLFLKRNSVKKRLHMYGKAQGAYDDRRARLLLYLERMKRHLNPGVYYEEPLPKFRQYVPMRTSRDVVKCVLKDLLDSIDYSRTERFV